MSYGGSVFQVQGCATARARRHPADPGAIVAPSDGPSPVQLVDVGHAAHGLGVVRVQYARKIRKSPTIRMVPSSVMVEGRRLRFAVSDNADAHGPDGPGSPPVWAVNIHGYFAGGGMYWRVERVLGGTNGLARASTRACPGSAAATRWSGRTSPWRTWPTRSRRSRTRSMPARPSCSATRWVAQSPCNSRTTARGAPSGVIYHDGVSTPAWKERNGIIAAVLSPLLPDVAPMVDMIAAVVFDLPDLAIGRM